MRLYVPLILLCLWVPAAYGQKISLKEAPSLQFGAAPELQAFEALQPLTFQSQFSLLYAASPGANPAHMARHEQALNAFIDGLAPKVAKAKTAEKKIKTIHREVHQAYLSKYVLINHFSSIFSKGEYNCVSATALYGLVLQQLNIPFAIQESPNHVFLVAYPAAERIALESTDPQVGYIAYNAKFKQEYISQLRKMKLISEKEYQSKGVETLFNELYYNNQAISMQELIALQYYNDGLYLLDEEKYEAALFQFEKGYSLYPSDRGGFLMYTSMLLAKDKTTYADTAYIHYLVKLANLQGIDNHQDQLVGEFAHFTLDQLASKGQVAHYDKMYNRLIGQLNDSLLINEISYIYSFEKGRVAYNAGKFTEALAWSEKAYQLQPHATNSSGLLTNSLAQRLNAIASFEEKTQLLENILKKYPSLQDNNLIYSQLLQFYLIQFGQAFELDQEKKGLQFRQHFEQAYQQNKGKSEEGYVLDTSLIGRAYSVAAVYYFRRGQTATARQYIARGLEFAPNNYELLQRRQMIQ
jgi:hypothetical protein